MNSQMKKNLLTTIKEFKDKKILVIGDIMLDLYIEGPPRSVSQEAPVIVVTAQKKYFKLGGAANAAENIKALGGKIYLNGVIGDHNKHDDFGRSFIETIKRSKISREGIFFDHSRPTTLKMRIISQGQQIVRVDEEITNKISKKIEDKLINHISTIIPKVDSILVSDYNKGVVTTRLMKFLIKESRKRNKKIVVDPKPPNKDLYRDVCFITPNEIELLRMYGYFEVNESSIIHLAKKLKQEMNISNVLVTRGARGMDLISNEENKARYIPSFAKKVIDVSGAGDTVAAVICMGIDDLNPYELSYLSAIAAKISVEKQGTASVSAKELIDNIQ